MNVLQQTRQKIHAWWEERSSRERKGLRTALGVVLAALALQIGWTAWHEIARLEPAVARLERATAVARVLVTDIERGAIPTPGATVPMPITKGGGNLPRLAGLTVTTMEPGRYRISGKVDFNDWLNWLANLHYGARLVLVRASVKAAGAAAVTVEAELEQAL
ncbi:MAG: type II secretion system protein M [Rhizobium sp.]|nr:type II secretion system protein M [Rhizobium sp.]